MEVFAERRCLVFLLVCVCLISLFVLPASAASHDVWYNYDGKLFPQVPYASIKQYPYQFIVESWTGDCIFVASDISPTVYTVSSGAYAIEFRNGNAVRSDYNSQTHTWNPLTESLVNSIGLGSTVYIWSNTDIYFNNQLFVSASQPIAITFPAVPRFTTNLERNKIYTYQLDQVAPQLFVQASTTSSYTLAYQWESYLNGEWSSIANTSSDPRYFTPPTTVEGTFQYRCLAYYETFGIESGAPSNTVYVVVGSGAVPDEIVSVGDQVIIDQISGVQDSINDVKDSIDSVNDSLNATSPDLDASIGAAENSSDIVDEFEDQQWNDIHDNIDSVTGAFDVFGDASLAAAFGFVGGIVNNTFDSLGNWQVVLTLPLALGLILYICSRAPLHTIPRAGDRAAREVDRAQRQSKKSGGGNHAISP